MPFHGIEIFAGSFTVIICSTAEAGKYSVVLPGKPNTMVKSPCLTPFSEMVNDFFGCMEYYQENILPACCLYRINTKQEKSPVCLGHIQLSVSFPKLPIAAGGPPTSRTSVISFL
jgi:hypothetical protein